MPVEENHDYQLQALKIIAADILTVPLSDVWFKQRPRLNNQSNNLFEAGYSSQRIILKEYLKPEEYDESPIREFRALELLSHLDIAPRPRAFFPHSAARKPVVVYDYMIGQMWDRRTPSQEELAMLAEIWIQTNEVRRNNLWLSRGQEWPILQIWLGIQQQFQKYFEWAESNFEPANKAVELCRTLYESRKEVVAALSDFEAPLCFCRADPRFANVIGRPDGRLGMVDWEDSGLRDPAKDIADIMNHPNQEDLLSQTQWRAFLDPYMAYHSRSDRALARRLHLYLGLFPVWWLAILLGGGLGRVKTGKLDEWRINDMEPNQRLRRYLARALAWPSNDIERKYDDLADLRFFPGTE